MRTPFFELTYNTTANTILITYLIVRTYIKLLKNIILWWAKLLLVKPLRCGIKICVTLIKIFVSVCGSDTFSDQPDFYEERIHPTMPISKNLNKTSYQRTKQQKKINHIIKTNPIKQRIDPLIKSSIKKISIKNKIEKISIEKLNRLSEQYNLSKKKVSKKNILKSIISQEPIIFKGKLIGGPVGLIPVKIDMMPIPHGIQIGGPIVKCNLEKEINFTNKESDYEKQSLNIFDSPVITQKRKIRRTLSESKIICDDITKPLHCTTSDAPPKLKNDDTKNDHYTQMLFDCELSKKVPISTDISDISCADKQKKEVNPDIINELIPVKLNDIVSSDIKNMKICNISVPIDSINKISSDDTNDEIEKLIGSHHIKPLREIKHSTDLSYTTTEATSQLQEMDTTTEPRKYILHRSDFNEDYDLNKKISKKESKTELFKKIFKFDKKTSKGELKKEVEVPVNNSDEIQRL